MKTQGRRQSSNMINASKNDAAYNVKSAIEDAGKGKSAVTNVRKQIKDEPYDLHTDYSNYIVRGQQAHFAKKLAFDERFNKDTPSKLTKNDKADRYEKTPEKGPIPKNKDAKFFLK